MRRSFFRREEQLKESVFFETVEINNNTYIRTSTEAKLKKPLAILLTLYGFLYVTGRSPSSEELMTCLNLSGSLIDDHTLQVRKSELKHDGFLSAKGDKPTEKGVEKIKKLLILP